VGREKKNKGKEKKKKEEKEVEEEEEEKKNVNEERGKTRFLLGPEQNFWATKTLFCPIFFWCPGEVETGWKMTASFSS
jgi:hypothetical protein